MSEQVKSLTSKIGFLATDTSNTDTVHTNELIKRQNNTTSIIENPGNLKSQTTSNIINIIDSNKTDDSVSETDNSEA